MKGFVSSRWISVVAWVAAMTVVWSIFVPFGLPKGLVWISVLGLTALSAALWMRLGSTRSTAQLIEDVEAEPLLAGAAPPRLGHQRPQL